MLFYARIFNDQYVIGHFSIPYSEWKDDEFGDKLVEDLLDSDTLTKEKVIKELKRDIAVELDDYLLEKYSTFSIGAKEINFLLLEKGKPIIGIFKCISLSIINKVNLPIQMSKEMIITVGNHMVSLPFRKWFNEYLIKNDFCYFNDSVEIKQNSIIEMSVYSINKKGELSKRAKKISYDMFIDSYLNSNLLLGKKVGETINDEKCQIVIDQVFNRIVYNEDKYELEVLNKYGIKDFKSLKILVEHAYYAKEKIDKLVDVIIDFVAKNTRYKLNKDTLEFYARRSYLPFNDEGEIKYRKTYYLEMFSRMFDLDSNIKSSPKSGKYNIVQSIKDYMKVLNIKEDEDDIVSSDEFQYEFMKYRFLYYCDNEGFIKGLKGIY